VAVISALKCVISGFRRDVEETCDLLGYYAALSGSLLPTFRDNLSVPSSRVKRKMELTDFPLTSVYNYNPTLRNIPEECRFIQW
jgi:hypothetical protein